MLYLNKTKHIYNVEVNIYTLGVIRSIDVYVGELILYRMIYSVQISI